MFFLFVSPPWQRISLHRPATFRTTNIPLYKDLLCKRGNWCVFASSLLTSTLVTYTRYDAIFTPWCSESG